MADTNVKASVKLSEPVIDAGPYFFTRLGHQTLRFDTDGNTCILTHVDGADYRWLPISEWATNNPIRSS